MTVATISLLAVGAVVAGNLLQRPRLALLLLVALVPYDGLLLLVDHPSVLDGWKEALAGVVVVGSFLQRSGTPTRLPTWAVPAVLLAALAAVSVVSPIAAGSLFGLKIGFYYLLVPLALLWSPLDPRSRDRLVTILMANGLIVAVVGLGQQLAGAEALHALGYEYNETIRWSGGTLRSFSTFNQPFAFGYFLMLVLLVGAPIAFDDHRRPRNRIFLVSSPLLLTAMAFTVVRGALFGLAVGAIYLGLVRYRALGHVLLLLPLVVAAALLAGLAADLSSPSSLEQRASGWFGAMTAETISPLGDGIGTTGAAAERAIDSGAGDGALVRPDRYQPDNFYIKTLIELGPIGLWLLVWTVGAAIIGSHRVAHRLAPGADLSLTLGITAASLGASAAALVSSYWEIFPVDMLYWTLLGVVTSIDRTSSSTPWRCDPVAAGSRPTAVSSSPLSITS